MTTHESHHGMQCFETIYLKSTTEAKDEMKGRFLLDVVIREGSSIFKLLSCKNQTLLFWRNAFLVLNLRFHVLNRVVWFDIQGDRLSREGLDEDLHGTTSKSKDKMEGGLLLNVVIRKGSPILELFTGEDQSLLLRWDAFLVLNFCLDILNGVIGLDVQGNRLSGEGLDEDLHGTTSKSEHKMKSGFFLNVIIGKSSSIFKLFSGKDQSLLLGGNSLLVLNFCLDVLNRIIRCSTSRVIVFPVRVLTKICIVMMKLYRDYLKC